MDNYHRLDQPLGVAEDRQIIVFSQKRVYPMPNLK